MVLNTTCYQAPRYILNRDLYYKHINDFKKRHVKLLAKRQKGLEFSVNLLGFDGTLKFKGDYFNLYNLFKIIDNMTMSQKVNVL